MMRLNGWGCPYMDDFVVIALGANLAFEQKTPLEILKEAGACLGAAGFLNLRFSSIWQSRAWPDPTQPPYFNQVCVGKSYLTAFEALQLLLEVEKSFGRQRSITNAPRTLDLDLIAFGAQVVRSEDLILPHPRAHERRFVMGPLAELCPDMILPGQILSVSDLARLAPVGRDADLI